MDILGHSVVAKIHVVIDENSCERFDHGKGVKLKIAEFFILKF